MQSFRSLNRPIRTLGWVAAAGALHLMLLNVLPSWKEKPSPPQRSQPKQISFTLRNPPKPADPAALPSVAMALTPASKHGTALQAKKLLAASRSTTPSTSDPPSTSAPLEKSLNSSLSKIADYASLLPKGDRYGDSGYGNSGSGSEPPFRLLPEQTKQVTFFLDGLQMPLTLRKNFHGPLKAQMHLLKSEDSLTLVYLTGDPYLRAEIYEQMRQDKTIQNFDLLLQSLAVDELFIRIDWSTAAARSSNTNYRSTFADRTLNLAVQQTYAPEGGNMPDPFAKRAREIDRFREKALTASPAFNRIVRNQKFQIR